MKKIISIVLCIMAGMCIASVNTEAANPQNLSSGLGSGYTADVQAAQGDLHVEVEAAFPVIIKVFNPNGTLVAQTVGNTCYVTLNQGAYEVAVFSMDGTHLTSRKVLLNGYSYILIEL